MEMTIKIPTPDKKIIYGTLMNPKKTLANSNLVLIVHGMTGDRYESKSRSTAKALYDKGIASLRISLYSWEPKARSFSDCSLITHADDLNAVYKYLNKEGVAKILGAGHSLGFPSLLASDLSNLSGLISWDGTSENHLKKPMVYKCIKGTRIKYLPWGNDILVHDDMIDRLFPVNFLGYAKTMQKFKLPMLFIAAEDVLLKDIMKESKYLKSSKLVIIKGAGHNFDQIGCEEKLVNHTVKFCSKLLQ